MRSCRGGWDLSLLHSARLNLGQSCSPGGALDYISFLRRILKISQKISQTIRCFLFGSTFFLVGTKANRLPRIFMDSGKAEEDTMLCSSSSPCLDRFLPIIFQLNTKISVGNVYIIQILVINKTGFGRNAQNQTTFLRNSKNLLSLWQRFGIF